jgi:hypothetical protein
MCALVLECVNIAIVIQPATRTLQTQSSPNNNTAVNNKTPGLSVLIQSLTLNACALDLACVNSAVVIKPAASTPHHQQLPAVAVCAVRKDACSRVLSPVHVLKRGEQEAVDNTASTGWGKVM